MGVCKYIQNILNFITKKKIIFFIFECGFSPISREYLGMVEPFIFHKFPDSLTQRVVCNTTTSRNGNQFLILLKIIYFKKQQQPKLLNPILKRQNLPFRNFESAKIIKKNAIDFPYQRQKKKKNIHRNRNLFFVFNTHTISIEFFTRDM